MNKRGRPLAQRYRIVPAAAEGTSNTEVAAQVGVGMFTVGKWRSRFLADRLDGLIDEPRPGLCVRVEWETREHRRVGRVADTGHRPSRERTAGAGHTVGRTPAVARSFAGSKAISR